MMIENRRGMKSNRNKRMEWKPEWLSGGHGKQKREMNLMLWNKGPKDGDGERKTMLMMSMRMDLYRQLLSGEERQKRRRMGLKQRGSMMCWLLVMRKEGFQVFLPIQFCDYHFDNCYCFDVHSVRMDVPRSCDSDDEGGGDTFHSMPSVTDHSDVREKRRMQKKSNLLKECDEKCPSKRMMEHGEKWEEWCLSCWYGLWWSPH